MAGGGENRRQGDDAALADEGDHGEPGARDAMGGRQHAAPADQRAGAAIGIAGDDQHGGARQRVSGADRRAADDGLGGRGREQGRQGAAGQNGT